MKNSILVLTTLAALTAAEQRSFLAPQTSYGTPQKQITVEPLRAQLAAKIISSKLTIEQLIRLTEQLSSQQATVPSSTYGQPQGVPQATYGVPNRLQHRPVPQTAYGVPPNPQQQPQQPQPLQPPATSYGVPSQGTTTNLEHFDRIRVPQGQNLPVFNPQNFRGQEKNQYNTIEPIIRDIENAKLQNGLSKQFLPVKEPTDFKGQNSFNNNNPVRPVNVPQRAPNQYVPPQRGLGPREHFPDSGDIRPGTVRNIGDINPSNFDGRRLPSGTGNFGTEPPVLNEQEVDQKYLPPTSTRRPTPTRFPVRPVGSTPVPESPEVPESTDTEESTETPVRPEGTPNVAVSTAVAGGDLFYLHPDGRLQRVILQKTPQEAVTKLPAPAE